MHQYFEGATRQLEGRVRHLIGTIPRNLDRDLDALIDRCRERLGQVAQGFADIRENSDFKLPQNQGVRLRIFRRLVTELDQLESIPVAALRRWSDTDRRLNRLIEMISREISYPLTTPVVSATSQSYYHIYPRYHLVLVPPAEGLFLLHLPDLYHELAHPILESLRDPKIEPLQKAQFEALTKALEYVDGEEKKQRGRVTPNAFILQLRSWSNCWDSWITELFCDLYAVYTLGPAYVWGHYHLCATRGGDPFQVPAVGTITHPPDAARMYSQLVGLVMLGFGTERAEIEANWRKLLATNGDVQTPDFNRCFPDALLSEITAIAFRGMKAIDCRRATPTTNDEVHMTLNEAWRQFWGDPVDYPGWESSAASRLGLSIS